MKARSTIKIDLTEEQKEQIRRVTGKETPAVKLNLEALEERLAPSLSSN